jgi:propanediol dehydratase small subunit
MFKIGAERLAALSEAAASFSDADYLQAIAHPRLVKIKDNKELLTGILETTLLESEVKQELGSDRARAGDAVHARRDI